MISIIYFIFSTYKLYKYELFTLLYSLQCYLIFNIVYMLLLLPVMHSPSYTFLSQLFVLLAL